MDLNGFISKKKVLRRKNSWEPFRICYLAGKSSTAPKIFFSLIYFFISMKPLRFMAAHFLHLFFSLQLGCTICLSQVCKKSEQTSSSQLVKDIRRDEKVELGENSQFRPPNFSIDKSQQIALVVRSKLKRRKKMMKVLCVSFRTTADDLIMSNGKSTQRAVGRSEILRGAYIVI